MTVRWKPLLILSGLFVAIAVIGVIAMVYSMVPRNAGDILPLARSERSAKKYDEALIQYKRALQQDGRNAAIHEEMAGMFGEWAATASAERKGEVEALRIAALINAAKYGKKLKEPRRLLLADALGRDVAADSLGWAKEMLSVEPANADAHFVLASELLESPSPNIPEIKRHLASLESAKAPPARVVWVKARLAQQTGDDPGLKEALTLARTLSLPADADPVDHMALLRLRALDVQVTTDPAQLAERVHVLQAEARALLTGPAPAPARITKLSLLLEQIQKTLTLVASNAEPKAKAQVTQLVDAIEGDVETLFQKALEPASKPDLQVYLTYADHLRFRQKGQRCLEVVDQALASSAASRASHSDLVMGLHAVAVEAALARLDDESRFQRSAPHIAKLIDCSLPMYQGLGHLFQGAIDLENSGVGHASSRQTTPRPSLSPAAQQKLRASALNHLKLAASRLPRVAEAQARYGVALVLSMEQALGRQYLQTAMKLGNLDPQYQVWAAWSMVQAGYPEEAEPIVTHLLGQIAQGRQSRDLEGTLHLLNGEIHQSRRDPADLRIALDEYDKSVAAGQKHTPAVQLRLAQIEVQLGQHDRALKRIDTLRKQGAGGTAAEHLAVLTLQDQGKPDEARAALERARKQYPESSELVGLDAAMHAKAGQPREADRILEAYLAGHPDEVSIVLMRAQILSELLADPKGARKLLSNVADRSENSQPLVQLALLDLKQHDHDAVAAAIAKIRARWKEAAVADLLDAQLALDQGNLSGAVAAFDAALKKDPSNKLVQFWKAQLDSRNGATKDATKSLETIARGRPIKEVDSGLSLRAAAESALAGIALQSGDVDGAIQRLEDLRSKGRDQLGGLTRADRWQLATAYASKGEWDRAKKEVASILNDPKDPPSFDERVRGANFYRLHDDDEAALAQLDYVIKVDPAHPAGVVTRAYILAGSKKNEEAAALLRRAIAASKGKPPGVFYLMLAAIETLTPPAEDAHRRALVTIDEGLKSQPDALDLVQARYRVLRRVEGDKAALAYVESKAKGGAKAFRRLLVEACLDQKDYAEAERTLRTLAADNPKDSQTAANLIRVVAQQALAAVDRGERDRARSLNEKCAALIRESRARFPNDLAFLQAECDLVARRGDYSRAIEVTREMDKLAGSSPAGPMIRARIFSAQGRLREASSAYAEALERNPRQFDARILLGQVSLKLDEFDEALRQAKLVLEVDHDQPDALILQARALSSRTGSQGAESRARAVDLLSAALRKNPRFVEAHHLKAEIQLAQGERAKAVATLKEGLKAVPDDAVGLSQVIQHLTEPRDGGRPPSPAEVADAKALAEASGDADKKGHLRLAIAVGFHKAGQLDLALPWAEKAAETLDTPLVHLDYGDLLLSIAEATADPTQAKALFRRAVDQYDLVLKAQASSVEAVNNKAWILHTHLGQSREALELAQGLLKRVDPASLPGEFFDTLGAIQEGTGHTRDAEESYGKGLLKAGEHPVLNYHMGKLISADRKRASKAISHLEKAQKGRNRLSPKMAADLDSVMAKLGIRAN